MLWGIQLSGKIWEITAPILYAEASAARVSGQGLMNEYLR